MFLFLCECLASYLSIHYCMKMWTWNWLNLRVVFLVAESWIPIIKLNGQNHISFQLLSPENSMFLLCGKASHTKPVPRNYVHCGSLSARKCTKDGIVFALRVPWQPRRHCKWLSMSLSPGTGFQAGRFGVYHINFTARKHKNQELQFHILYVHFLYLINRLYSQPVLSHVSTAIRVIVLKWFIEAKNFIIYA